MEGHFHTLGSFHDTEDDSEILVTKRVRLKGFKKGNFKNREPQFAWVMKGVRLNFPPYSYFYYHLKIIL